MGQEKPVPESTAAQAAPLAARVEQQQARDRGLRLGVHSFSLRQFTFDEAIAMTRELGLRHFGVDPNHVPLDSSNRQIAAARNKAASCGLALMATGVVSLMRGTSACRDAFEYARALGVRVIACHPERDSLDTLEALVDEYDVILAIHNHGPEGLYATPDDVLRAIDGRDPRVGACVDLGHYERVGVRAGDALRALRGRVYDVHLKDVDRRDASGQSVVHGTGVVDFQDVFRTLLEMEFSYHVAMEYEADADNPLPGMRKSLAHARAVLAGL